MHCLPVSPECTNMYMACIQSCCRVLSRVEMLLSHPHPATIILLAKGVFHWDNPDEDQWSKITWIIVHKKTSEFLSTKTKKIITWLSLTSVAHNSLWLTNLVTLGFLIELTLKLLVLVFYLELLVFIEREKLENSEKNPQSKNYSRTNNKLDLRMMAAPGVDPRSLWTRIRQLLWCTMIQVVSDH